MPAVRTTLFTRNLTGKRIGYALGVLLSITIGNIFLGWSGDGLARFSYDTPFFIHVWHAPPEDLIMVYLDAPVKSRMGQPADKPLDRRFYPPLLERLTKEKAKVVLFDFIFDEPSSDALVDREFAAAIRQNGQVVLVAQEIRQQQANDLTESVLPPIQILADAAAGRGLANVDDDKTDSTVRRLYAGSETYPSAGWEVARILAASATNRNRLEERWLNYYCLPQNLRAVNFDQVLQTNSLPDNYFSGKIVVLGARSEPGIAGASRDTFGNPFPHYWPSTSPGAVIHAFSALNLINGDWLKRLSFRSETIIVIAWGLFISILLMRLSPWLAVGTAVAVAAAFTLAAAYIQLKHHIWFSWAVPVAVQTPLALVWAVGYRYAFESRRRKRLREAFAAYVSPAMADRIANSEYALASVGKEVEATIMFTDLEGFTSLAETLSPGKVSEILTSYFDRATQSILDEDGLLIKFIGDAVMAAWGAPLPAPSPAERAVRAAWKIAETGKVDIAGRRLRTRLGINTGLVLAANVGADVPLLGDAINVAARLESLNKQLGTEILISDSTASPLDGGIQLRSLGKFVVAGRTNPIGICEVLGLGSTDNTPQWLSTFNRAREQFVSRDFDQAEALFREVIAHRGKDGPAEFFLKQIETLRAKPPTSEKWNGVIKLDTK
jgi:adenylate cyclase